MMKRLFIAISFLLFGSTSYGITMPPWEMLSGVESQVELASAIATTSQKTVLIRAPITLSSNITVPSNIDLMFVDTGEIVIPTGFVATISGSIQASPKRIFSGAGTVQGSHRCGTVFPQWFGTKSDGTTDDSDALSDAITFSLRGNSDKLVSMYDNANWVTIDLNGETIYLDGRVTAGNILQQSSNWKICNGGISALASFTSTGTARSKDTLLNLYVDASNQVSVVVENIVFNQNNLADGINCEGALGVKISNCFFTEIASGHYGIYDTARSNELFVEKSYFRNVTTTPAGEGIHLKYDSFVTDCVFVGLDTGIGLDYTAPSGAGPLHIDRCTCYNSEWFVKADSTAGSVGAVFITNCTLDSPSFLGNGKGCVISHNYFNRVPTGAAFYLSDATSISLEESAFTLNSTSSNASAPYTLFGPVSWDASGTASFTNPLNDDYIGYIMETATDTVMIASVTGSVNGIVVILRGGARAATSTYDVHQADICPYYKRPDIIASGVYSANNLAFDSEVYHWENP